MNAFSEWNRFLCRGLTIFQTRHSSLKHVMWKREAEKRKKRKGKKKGRKKDGREGEREVEKEGEKEKEKKFKKENFKREKRDWICSYLIKALCQSLRSLCYKNITQIQRSHLTSQVTNEGDLLRWQTEFALIGWFVLKEEAELTDKEQSLVHSKS